METKGALPAAALLLAAIAGCGGNGADKTQARPKGGDAALPVPAKADAGVSWGEARDGVRMGLSPAKTTLGRNEGAVLVWVWYENQGKKYAAVPVHKTSLINLYRIMFAGEKAGKPFQACFFCGRNETIGPGKKEVPPDGLYGEEYLLPLPVDDGSGHFRAPAFLPSLAAGESLTLQVGLCADEPHGEKDWNAPETLKSGAIAVARGMTETPKPQPPVRLTEQQARELAKRLAAGAFVRKEFHGAGGGVVPAEKLVLREEFQSTLSFQASRWEWRCFPDKGPQAHVSFDGCGTNCTIEVSFALQ